MNGFALFQAVGGRLRIELSEPPSQYSERLLNRVASPSAHIVSLSLELEVWPEGADEPRALTEAEWASVVVTEPVIRIRGDTTAPPMEHQAPNGRHFTVRDLRSAIEQTARARRAESNWLGGVDVHHIFFEGMHAEPDGSWTLRWGS